VRTNRDRAISAATVLAALAPLVVRSGDVWTSGSETLLLLLAAMGLNVAMGYAGQPSLGQGGFVALGAYTAAVLIAKHGWDVPAAVLLGTALAAVAGGFVARGVSRLRPPFVALATWLFAWAIAFAIIAFPGLTGGAAGLPLGETSLRMHALGVTWGLGPIALYEVALALVAVAIVLHTMLVRRYGPAFASVRADAPAARSAGIPVERIRFGALAGSAAVGGLAGGLLALNAHVADPTAYGPLLSVKLFVVVLLGGAARRLGPAVGLLAVAVISAAGSAYASAAGASAATVEPMAAAAVLGAVLVFGTEGLIPLIDRPKPKPPATARASAPPPIPPWKGATLSARGIAVSFGGVGALEGVDLLAEAGTAHAIIGPNGSGKTTLLRVLSGAVAPDGGSVAIDGAPLPPGDPVARANAGITRTLQRTAVTPGTTALGYVIAGTEIRRPSGPLRGTLGTPRARREEAGALRRAKRALASVGLGDFADVDVSSLTGAAQRLLQIARALAPDPQVLLLDEPSAGFGRDAEAHLVAVIDGVRSAGLTVVIVEHNLRVVRAIADRVTVLDAGRTIAEGTPDEVAVDPAVRSAYLGTAPDRMPGRDLPEAQPAARNRPDAARASDGGVQRRSQGAVGERGGDPQRAGGPGGDRRETDRAGSDIGGRADQRRGRGTRREQTRAPRRANTRQRAVSPTVGRKRAGGGAGRRGSGDR
jgi:ABC-type branched-subunit amino acid transport system ATPase component/ABC-type branched-subunit amino acid transport system permease subunit